MRHTRRHAKLLALARPGRTATSVDNDKPWASLQQCKGTAALLWNTGLCAPQQRETGQPKTLPLARLQTSIGVPCSTALLFPKRKCGTQ